MASGTINNNNFYITQDLSISDENVGVTQIVNLPENGAYLLIIKVQSGASLSTVTKGWDINYNGGTRHLNTAKPEINWQFFYASGVVDITNKSWSIVVSQKPENATLLNVTFIRIC